MPACEFSQKNGYNRARMIIRKLRVGSIQNYLNTKLQMKVLHHAHDTQRADIEFELKKIYGRFERIVP